MLTRNKAQRLLDELHDNGFGTVTHDSEVAGVRPIGWYYTRSDENGNQQEPEFLGNTYRDVIAKIRKKGGSG